MKMLLLSPAQLNEDGRPLRVKKTFLTPLSIYLLAGLTPREWDVEIANDYCEDIPYDGGYDLVGISATTLHSARGYQIADEFRRRGVKVVMGGFHPTLFTEEAAKHCDAIVVGEAELVWKDLLDDVAAGRLKPIYKADRLADLVSQPVPRYDLFNRGKYINDIMPAESTRGCPYDCDYCSVTQFYGRKYRFRPVAEVARDIAATGTRFIGFVDDNIAGKLSYSAELFEALIPLKIFWMSQVSIRLADDERVLALAARSGCRYAIIGIETIDETNLEAVGKKIVNRVDEYVAKTKMFRKHGITVAANLMFGFDNDNEESFRKTYRFVVENRFMPNPYIITPYPGTRLFDGIREQGRLLHENFQLYTSYRTVFRPKNFAPERLDELFIEFYRGVFSIRNIVQRSLHMLRYRFSWGHLMTQVALMMNSLLVRRNVMRGILPYY